MAETEETLKTEEFLDNNYQYVLKLDYKELTPESLDRFRKHKTEDTVCVDRNLHNGQTKEITVKAIIETNKAYYIAGHEKAKTFQ